MIQNSRFNGILARFRRFPVVCAILTCALITGCANAVPYRGMDISSDPQTQFITLTPVAQADSQDCGFACMATVALYHGVTPSSLRHELIVKNFRGRRLNGMDLVNMAKALALVAYSYQGDVEDLKKNLGMGRPVIVLLSGRPRTASFPSFGWSVDNANSILGSAHWVVVAAIASDGDFVIYDPAQGCLKMDNNAFLDSWESEAGICVLAAVPAKK